MVQGHRFCISGKLLSNATFFTRDSIMLLAS